MQLIFDNCDVTINGSGILATSASIASENSIESAYILGYKGPTNQIPNGPIKSVINYTYIPVISQEVNFGVSNKIKKMTDDSNYFGEKLELAGLTNDYCFLDNYNIKTTQNNIVEADSSYTTFWPLCGGLRNKTNNINYLNNGDIAHSWSTYIVNSGDYNIKPIYNFNYNFRATWQPMYVVGQIYPVQVKLLSAQETISFDMDNYRNILFTGEEIYNNIFNGNNVTFGNLTLQCSDGCSTTGSPQASSLLLNISGFKVKNVLVSSQVGELVRVNYQANRYY
jgi:hypothetical protein